jgi:phosphoribosylanthranilate isomerase
LSFWIKICGTTSIEDARLAIEAGADAVGFVFAPSPRRVTVEQVAAITAHLPASVEKIGVFVDAPLEEIEAAVCACGLTGAQLHSDVGMDATARLKERFGAEFRVLRAMHFSEGAAEQAAEIDGDPNVDAILIDSRTAMAVGGTGVAFDWQAAQNTLFKNEKGRKPRVAAGGLTPGNVAEAVATLHPWGVDVVSGVEAAPRKKEPAKVREFVANARAAASEQ